MNLLARTFFVLVASTQRAAALLGMALAPTVPALAAGWVLAQMGFTQVLGAWRPWLTGSLQGNVAG